MISARSRLTSVFSANPASLDAEEFREMADHTIVGHQIVTGVQFPWPSIPEIVRWHHERSDGSGYPDGLLPKMYPCRCASSAWPTLSMP